MSEYTASIMTFVLLSAVCSVCAPALATPPPTAKSNQALVVKAAGWDKHTATLQCYERKDAVSSWVTVGKKMPAVIGRKGLGWGAGIHPAHDGKGATKQEGDGKAPAGVFRLGSAFGYEPASRFPWVRLPYRQATGSIKCVDDTSSKCYNRIVDAVEVKSDWKSHEEMLRADDLYRLGIVIEHNTDPVVAGRGSCIFLHIWKSATTGTAGCTAVSSENMELLQRWLDPAAKPILIQLPETEYKRLRKSWELP